MDLRVGTIKSMVHSNFTIDVKGKDTYRHRKAGASFVISLSRNETAFIRTNTHRQDLEEISRLFPEDTDVVVAEGLHDTGPGIFQLIACKDLEMLEETMRVRNIGENVVALSGLMANKLTEHSRYPIFNVMKDDELNILVEILIERIGL
jgi:molybdopterin-guanine dinucleotide biosynthesis protein MobB